VLGQPLYPNDEMEASIRGAAIYAIEKLGLPAPGAQFGKAIRPRAKWARVYAAERQRQIDLEALLSSG
jgi:gluconokinase